MELLIASTIFAMIMIIVVATFSWASGYNNKLLQTRKVTKNGQLVLEELTNQVRLANGTVKFQILSTDEIKAAGPFVIMTCTNNNNSSCLVGSDQTPTRYKTSDYDNVTYTTSGNRALLIFRKDINKIYFYRTQIQSSIKYRTVKSETSFSDWDGTLTFDGEVTPPSTTTPDVLNEDDVTIWLSIGGCAPVKGNIVDLTVTRPDTEMLNLNTNREFHHYVEIYLRAQTYYYNYLKPTDRAQFEARTVVESRYYH